MFMNDLHWIFHDGWIPHDEIEKLLEEEATLFVHYCFLLAFCPDIHLFCQGIHLWKLYLRILFTQRIV